MRRILLRSPDETGSGALWEAWPDLLLPAICGRRSRRSCRLSCQDRGVAGRPVGPRGADGHPVRAEVGPAMGDAASRDGMRLWHELLATPTRLARGRVWAALRQMLLERLQAAGQLDGCRAALDTASVQARRGVGLPRQARRIGAGQEASAISRSMPEARTWRNDRTGQPARQPHAGGNAGCHPLGRERKARPTATTAHQAACRQGLRLPALPPGVPRPWHPVPYRQARHR